MARIKGVEIPKNKRIVIALTYIYGIGNSLAKQICKEAKVDENTKAGDLTKEQLEAIRTLVSDETTEGDLRRERKQAIDTKKEIGSYEGIRHRRGLPVRGQRTNNNCSNSKKAGKRKTVANKKK